MENVIKFIGRAATERLKDQKAVTNKSGFLMSAKDSLITLKVLFDCTVFIGGERVLLRPGMEIIINSDFPRLAMASAVYNFEGKELILVPQEYILGHVLSKDVLDKLLVESMQATSITTEK